MINSRVFYLALFLVSILIPYTAYSQSSGNRAAGRVHLEFVDEDTGKQVSQELYQHSYALLVGASRYNAGWPELPGVLKDLQQVEATLEKHGFVVETVLDPTGDELDSAYQYFVARYGQKEKARLLFYFAGHGHTRETSYGGKTGYIVPVDAPLPHVDWSGFRSKALNLDQLQSFARDIDTSHVLFLFDSCFSGSILEARSAVTPPHISHKVAHPTRQFLTSGSAEETVPDDSVFCRQFCEALDGEGDVNKDGYVTAMELYSYLHQKVLYYTDKTQTPQYGVIRDDRLDKGDFVFALKESPASIYSSSSFGIPSQQPKNTPSISATDLTAVAPKGGKPGIELLTKPEKHLSQADVKEGVLFSWRATGEAYGATYTYRLDDRDPVENFRRSSVIVRDLELGQPHTFQVMSVTKSGKSDPAVYHFQVMDNEPPQVEILHGPTANATVVGKAIHVLLGGYDSDGRAVRYILAIDDPNDPEMVFEQDSAYFEIPGDLLGDAPHRLIAQVVDDNGAESVPVTRDFVFRYGDEQIGQGTSKLPEGLHPGKVVSALLESGVSMDFVYIPGGTFLMGSSEDEEGHHESEGPITPVSISRGFWMSKTEVTQAQWSDLMTLNLSHFKGAQNPVEKVSWNDAVAYCIELSARYNLKATLPTEAQWEYACRAGTRTPFYTDDLASCSWFDGGKSQPVAQKKANAWGLYDMHGNVWEWCQDHAGGTQPRLPGIAVNDYVNETDGELRIIRGGAWNSNALDCRSANRESDNPELSDPTIGFRVVLSEMPGALEKAIEGQSVQTTASGLQYIVLKEGTGPRPEPTDTVTVHYEGMLVDGTVFDSSYARGKPATFGLKHLILGWQEGIPMMKVGAKWKLIIPPELGYGNTGVKGMIPGDSTLIFEIELLGIEGE